MLELLNISRRIIKQTL